MNRTFTKIPQETFDNLQVDAGVMLKTFDPENPAIAEGAIITATTGGITVECKPTYSDWGEDVDNCPNGMMELQHLDGWNCRFATTAIGTSPELIKLELGAAVQSGTKVTPRASLEQEDFSTIWWVGDKADGGFLAVKLFNALSTAGFSLKTTKNGKGNIDLEMTGHVSMAAQDVVPMEFYSIDGEDAGAEWIYTAVTPESGDVPSEEGWYVLVGDEYRLTNDAAVDENVTYYERTSA